MKKATKALAGLCVAAGGMSMPAVARAAFVDGTVAVVRLGDGSGNVPFNTSNLAQPVTIDVYNVRTGGLVSSNPLPSASTDAGRFVLSSNGADDSGRLNLSADGKYLTLGGYRSAPGATDPTTVAIDRVVARLDTSFAPDTSTTLAGAYANVAIAAVATTDGKEFWTAGGNDTTVGTGGLRYVPTVGGSASVNVSRTQSGSNADSYRGLRIIDGQLVGNTASQGSFTNRGSYRLQIAGALPRASSPTASTATPIIVNREGQPTDAWGNIDFDSKGAQQTNGKQYPKTDGVYLDLDGDGTRETAYTTGGKDDFEKWTLSNGNWIRRDSMFLSSALDINALEAFRDGSNVDLLVSTDTGIYKLVDTGGIGSFVDPSGQLAAADGFNRRFYSGSFFLTPGANNQFRGLALVPEPTSSGLVATAAASLLGLRRRRRAGLV